MRHLLRVVLTSIDIKKTNLHISNTPKQQYLRQVAVYVLHILQSAVLKTLQVIEAVMSKRKLFQKSKEYRN
jgi:hypothetical protein